MAARLHASPSMLGEREYLGVGSICQTLLSFRCLSGAAQFQPMLSWTEE